MSRGGRSWKPREPTLTRELKAGDPVKWYNRKWYYGEVLMVVQPMEYVSRLGDRILGMRPELSYLVKVDSGVGLRNVLWPRTNYLQEDK